MKYLIAVDGSPSAEAAWQFAQKLLKKDQDKVILVVVVEQWGFDYIDDISGAITVNEVNRMNDEIEKNSTTVLDHYTRKCKESGLEFEVIKGRGKAKEVIVEEAKTHGVDIIVVGSRGLGALSRLLIGSVSDYLVKNAPCPVLVVRETGDHKASDKKE